MKEQLQTRLQLLRHTEQTHKRNRLGRQQHVDRTITDTHHTLTDQETSPHLNHLTLTQILQHSLSRQPPPTSIQPINPQIISRFRFLLGKLGRQQKHVPLVKLRSEIGSYELIRFPHVLEIKLARITNQKFVVKSIQLISTLEKRTKSHIQYHTPTTHRGEQTLPVRCRLMLHQAYHSLKHLGVRRR